MGRCLIASFAALAAFGALAAPVEPPAPGRRSGAAQMMNELMAGQSVGGPFTLTDSRGRRRSLADFRGKVVLLYFGFTSCPDVCPTDLMAIGQAIRSLGPAGDEVQPVFVTIDPARDSRSVIGAYAGAFHERFVALTGSERQVRRVANDYKVFFERVPRPGGAGYTIDHAAFTFVLGRDGRYIGILPPGTPAERIAFTLREELGAPTL